MTDGGQGSDEPDLQSGSYVPPVNEGWRRDVAAPLYVPGAAQERSGRVSRRDRGRARRAEVRRRRRRGVIVLSLMLVLLLGAAVVGYRFLFAADDADFEGPGAADVVVQVAAGETTTDIASTLVDEGVVASKGAFLSAAKGDDAISSIHPGYYKLRTEIPAADAVDMLTATDARVGALVIPEGRQLADITTVDGRSTPGIISLIAEASCVSRNDRLTCMDREELQNALIAADPEVLGVADWALDRVRAFSDDPLRRYEGLIAAGSWDVDPDWSPTETLTHMITQSAESFNEMGLAETKATTGLSPYDTLIAASLIEREAQPEDFAKVARVIINRLAVDQQLQFDSTVNYALASQEVATTDEDRARVTPWNTYAMDGLPATPISAPGGGAIKAAENPADGDWLYFVTIDKDGTTVFTKDFEDHEASIVTARENGMLDSGR